MSSARAWRTNSTASSRAIPGCWARWSRATGSASRASSRCPSSSGCMPASACTSPGACSPGIATWLPALYAIALLVPVAGIAGAGDRLARRRRSRPAAGLPREPVRRACTRRRRQSIANLYAISRQPADRRAACCWSASWARGRCATSGSAAPASCVSTTTNAAASTQPTGLTILEMSRIAGIPHASVCGGRGRCSTCRVRIGGQDRAQLPPASAGGAEGAGAGRRAGQRAARLPAPPAARPLSRDAAAAGVGRPGRGLSPPAAGAWRRALRRHPVRRHPRLHLDLRGQAALRRGVPAQPLFPRHRPGHRGGRRPARQVHRRRRDGDLRPRTASPEVACRQALDAARRMALALDDLNEAMSGDLDQPLRIGIGLHAGPTIVGEMGYERATQLTAIGDTVNTASRLETLTKEFDVELVVSQELLDRAGVDLGGLRAPRRRNPRPAGPAGGARRQAGTRPHGIVIIISLPGTARQGKNPATSGGGPCARPFSPSAALLALGLPTLAFAAGGGADSPAETVDAASRPIPTSRAPRR